MGSIFLSNPSCILSEFLVSSSGLMDNHTQNGNYGTFIVSTEPRRHMTFYDRSGQLARLSGDKQVYCDRNVIQPSTVMALFSHITDRYRRGSVSVFTGYYVANETV